MYGTFGAAPSVSGSYTPSQNTPSYAVLSNGGSSFYAVLTANNVLVLGPSGQPIQFIGSGCYQLPPASVPYQIVLKATTTSAAIAWGFYP